MIDLLWDLHQERRLSDLEDGTSAARDANRAVRELERENVELQRRVDAMALTLSALFELMQARGLVTHDQLAAKMSEIDARDGVQDGRAAQFGPRPCQGCGRPIGQRHARCIYCGGTKSTL
jgi:hypothetical protein